MGIMEMVGMVGMVGRCAMTYVIRYYVQCTSVRPSGVFCIFAKRRGADNGRFWCHTRWRIRHVEKVSQKGDYIKFEKAQQRNHRPDPYFGGLFCKFFEEMSLRR